MTRKIPTGVRYVLPALAFLGLAGIFFWRLTLTDQGYAPNVMPPMLIDKPAPSFDLPPLFAGGPGLKTSDLTGRVTLVNFFASWCVPCRAEHPVLGEITKHGVALVGINYKDKPKNAKAFLAELGDPYRSVAIDSEGHTGIAFGVYGVPESYLIDKNGVVRFKQTGPLTPDIVRDKIVPLAKKLK